MSNFSAIILIYIVLSDWKAEEVSASHHTGDQVTLSWSAYKHHFCGVLDDCCLVSVYAFDTDLCCVLWELETFVDDHGCLVRLNYHLWDDLRRHNHVHRPHPAI